MSEQYLSIEQIPQLPVPSRGLPNNELYVRLGCIVCPHASCFKAVGISSDFPIWSRFPEEAQEIRNVIGTIEKRSLVLRGGSVVSEEACLRPCPESIVIQGALNTLNHEFNPDPPLA